MDLASAAVHHTIVAVDVESYSSAERTDFDRLAVREGMYDVVTAAFRESEIPWERCHVSDVGDSLLVLLPSEVPKIRTVDRLPHRLTAMLRRYNRTHGSGARMRLRMAVHAGEVHHDRNGIAGESVNFTCRLLDAKELKKALAESKAELALVVSDAIYTGTVRHDPAAPNFRRIAVDVKETNTHAWMSIEPSPESPAQPQPPPPVDRARNRATDKVPHKTLTRLVAAMEEIRPLYSSPGRDLLLELLPADIRSGIGQSPTPRTDFANIVTVCWRHPEGLDRLAEAAAFLFPLDSKQLVEEVAKLRDGRDD